MAKLEKVANGRGLKEGESQVQVGGAGETGSGWVGKVLMYVRSG